MALRQTYLSMKSKLPSGPEVVLVMRERGNDELAPSQELLDEFDALKKRYSPDSGFESEMSGIRIQCPVGGVNEVVYVAVK